MFELKCTLVARLMHNVLFTAFTNVVTEKFAEKLLNRN